MYLTEYLQIKRSWFVPTSRRMQARQASVIDKTFQPHYCVLTANARDASSGLEDDLRFL